MNRIERILDLIFWVGVAIFAVGKSILISALLVLSIIELITMGLALKPLLIVLGVDSMLIALLVGLWFLFNFALKKFRLTRERRVE